MSDTVTEAGGAPAVEELSAEDRAWQARRSTIAPLVFGVIGMAASPLLLGLVCGPIGLRAGLDLWRAGTRTVSVVIGVAASLLAVVLSVVAAVLWGSIVAGVLLTRDALRETQRWIGQPVAAAEVDALGADGLGRVQLATHDGDERLVLVFVAPDHPASNATLRMLADLLPKHPAVRVVAASSTHPAADVRRAILEAGLELPAIGRDSILPAPIDAVAIMPTIVVISRDGHIVAAAAGGRPPGELERMLGGEPATSSDSQR